MKKQSTPVLIVGAGPAGLVTALGLAHHGVRSILIERHAGTSIYPRATAVSLRSMEIFRGYGLEEQIRAFSLAVRPTMSVSSTLVSDDGFDVPLGFPSDEQALAVSPTRPALSPQDHVEPVLVRRIAALGMTELRFNTELIAMEQSSAGVRATIMDRLSGQTSMVDAGYLVGADGGRSTVRDLLGIEAVGPTDLEHQGTVLFRADLLSAVGDRLFGLYAVGGPTGSSIVVPMGPDDRWLLATRTTLDDAERLAADPDRAIAAIREATGLPDLDVEILASMPLTFAAQLATRWRVGNAFLIGDAAHRMPPFGGRGMNTAIADAHGLAWKLAWVVRGIAAPALLDSFEEERGPVGRTNIALALARYQERIAATGLVLDLPPGQGFEASPDGLAEDLGYVYRSRAIVREDVVPSIGAGVPTPGAFAPEARPGARAPHAWLEYDGGRMSTVDLFGDGMVLLTRGAGADWRRAVAALEPPPAVLWGLGALAHVPMAPSVPIALRTVGRGLADPDGAFARAYGLDDGGAVLVRPDGHVAWRSRSAPADHRSALVAAVAIALGTSSGSQELTAAA